MYALGFSGLHQEGSHQYITPMPEVLLKCGEPAFFAPGVMPPIIVWSGSFDRQSRGRANETDSLILTTLLDPLRV